MQKQLITDQLIEEYQKELERIKSKQHYDGGVSEIILSIKEDLVSAFLDRLQSLRQQEAQNVIEAYGVAKINVLTNNVRALQNGNDYFTQTFEQKGGEQK